MAKSPGRILGCKIAVPQVNLWVQKPALFTVWITHYFDCPGWLEIGNCCWEHEAKWTSHWTKEHTQALHRQTSASVSWVTLQQHRADSVPRHMLCVIFWLELRTVSMWLVMKESGQFQKWECFWLCRSHPNIYLIPSFWLGPAFECRGHASGPPLHCI